MQSGRRSETDRRLSESGISERNSKIVCQRPRGLYRKLADERIPKLLGEIHERPYESSNNDLPWERSVLERAEITPDSGHYPISLRGARGRIAVVLLDGFDCCFGDFDRFLKVGVLVVDLKRCPLVFFGSVSRFDGGSGLFANCFVLPIDLG
jgi:hypothetical protein